MRCAHRRAVGWRSAGLGLIAALGLLGQSPAPAQEPAEDPLELLTEAPPRDRSQAQSLLDRALPADAEARWRLLGEQYQAAVQLEDRVRQIALARQLAEQGQGQPDWGLWAQRYLHDEFTWGSSGQALQASEPWVSNARLPIGLRATLALRQAYFVAQGTDRAVLQRLWSRADGLAAEALGLADARAAYPFLVVQRLQLRSEMERWSGRHAAAVASLREAVGLARRIGTGAAGSALAPGEALGWLDGSLGMLCYALVRNGRAQEALEISQQHLAQWRAGQLRAGLGTRWLYREAMARVAARQFEAGLSAAEQSEALLVAAGARLSSHTRWLARQERVRALLGLRRWAEADALYREALEGMGQDGLARSRASDNRLLALLAAKNGRLDEAQDLAERQLRYRTRLYGAQHPLTQESAGLRGLVRLAAGQTQAALADYERLFTQLLDQPGSWLDLDERGLRGFVLGIAFEDYLQTLAEQGGQDKPMDPAWLSRAWQLSERLLVSSTQRALVDASARFLAGQPALQVLLEQEQAQRMAAQNHYAGLAALLSEEDARRKEIQSDDFKALAPEQRKAQEQALKALRDRIRQQQGGATELRQQLEQTRVQLARDFPTYAELLMPASPRPEALQALLRPGEALLLVRSLPEHTMVWLLKPGAPLRLQVQRLGQAELQQRVQQLRRQLDLSAQAGRKRPEVPLQALHGLYQSLLQPLEPALGGVTQLLFASDGPLASLPLGLLLSRAPAAGQAPAWVLRDRAVLQLPAATSLQALRRVAPAELPQALLGFGDPVFRAAMPGPAQQMGTRLRYEAEFGHRYAEMPALPETRGELQALARALGADPERDLVLGAAATRRAVLGLRLNDRRVIAFATHGLMPGELPGLARPALALSVDGDSPESPLLELDDVLGLRMQAHWVLLSACNTAAGEQGGAAMSGLVRGFFFAGARSVLATHWPVESESAAALSAALFAAGAGSGAERLRQVQLAMADGRLGQGRWRHPFFWAAHALFGDPGS